jgi:hypothetical protein
MFLGEIGVPKRRAHQPLIDLGGGREREKLG